MTDRKHPGRSAQPPGPPAVQSPPDAASAPMQEIDVEAGARNTAPGAPPRSADPGPRPHGETPGVHAPNEKFPAPGTSEHSRVVRGVAPPAGRGDAPAKED